MKAKPKHYFHQKRKKEQQEKLHKQVLLAQTVRVSLVMQLPKTAFLSLKKSLLRLLPKVIIFANLLLVTFLPSSSAFLFDQEASLGNTIRAGILDMTVTTATPNFNHASGMIIPGETATQSALWTRTADSLPFSYSQKAENFSGNTDLCNILNLKVEHHYYGPDLDLDGNPDLIVDEKYSGLLPAFDINSLGDDPDMEIPNSHDYYTNPDYSEHDHWYSYEVTLPEDTIPSLGNSICSFDITGSAWQLDPTLATGYWDKETFSSTISTGSWAKVSGLKFEDKNGDGDRDLVDGELGLEGWTIYAAKQFEKFDVQASGELFVTKPLTSGNDYLIRVKGTFSAGENITVDAKYSTRPPDSPTWTDSVSGYETIVGLLDLQIDDNSPDWGEYNNDHEYWLAYTGQGMSLNLDIFDTYSDNNTGFLEVTIFEAVLTDTTDDQGYYEIDFSSLSGEIIIAEKPQSGWQQTFPAKGIYSLATNKLYSNKDFGNHQVPPTPDIEKIVINEVYQNSDNNQEWLELYNSGTTTVNLSGWSIKDGASTGIDTIGNYTLSPDQFAVIVTNSASQTLIDQISTTGAIIITLSDANIGAGLNTTGDIIQLRKSDASVVDEFSWGDTKTPFNLSNLSAGESYARVSKGLDTNQASDWGILTTPNPGTNPHSHIQVSVNQEADHLILSFNNAYGFDSLKYSVIYNHLFGGVIIQEAVEGTKSKILEQNSLILSPLYFGTCSSEGLVCLPHHSIQDLTINLDYQKEGVSIGTSTLIYNWK